MGSIQEGDKVYDEQGRIRYVTAKSQVWQQRPCYRVSFSGGTSIIADENHLWSVTTGNDRHRGGNPRIMTTKQIYELGADRRGSLCFGRTPVLDGIKQHVLIPPYILGYWLGDGTRAHSEIAVGNKDVEEVVRLFSEEGYIPAVTDHEHSKRMRPAGLTRQLNTLGLLGNKHIPENYLWADSRQRLALLQGLMDSDGTAHVREHYPLKWVNADPLLIEQMDFLIRSLGGRPCRNVDVADGTVKERPNGYDIIHQKDHTALTFYLEGEAFRLQRKLANQERGCDRSYGHFLKQIEPVEPQDTVCIEVDSPSHLFLAGEAMVPTHNSLLRPIYLAWHIKKNLQEIEAIGIERDLTGVLIIHLPVNATATDKDKAIDLLEQFKADDMAGFTAPQFGPGEHERWRFEIINSPGSKSIDPDKVIQRYQLEIARTFLAQFLLLGQGETGSRAVGMTQRDMFEVALGAILQNLEETINRFMVPPLFRYNDFGQLAALPQIKAGRVSKGDMEKFAAALKNLTDSGLLTANRETEQFLRNEMDLPELPEEEEQPAQEETGQDEKAAREFAEDDDEDEEVPLPDPDDDEAWEQLEKESNKRIKKSGSRRTAAELLRFARPYNYEKKIAEHVEEYKGVMGGLAEQLRSGKITAAKWSYDSKVAITRYTMDGHRLGVARAMGLPVSKVKMTTEQRKVAISAIEEQSKYWSKFAKEVKEQLAAGKPLTPALDARARQYAGSVRSAGAGAVLAEQGDKKLRWVRFAGDSCETCLANGGKVKTAKEWREADVWPSHNVQCHGNCRCSFQEV